jgi:tight adherence protein C
MLIAFAIVLFTVAVYMVLDAVTVRQKQIAGSLARARRYGGPMLRESELTRDVTNRLIAPMVQRLAALATKLPMTQSPDDIRRRLISAGLGTSLNPTTFLAIKGAGVAGSVFLGVLLAGSGLLPVGNGLIFALIGAGIAFIAPDFIVGRKIRTRRAGMLVQLPEVLDLLCVSVEAGLGFDAAMARITERSTGPLLEELSIVLHEMRIGESRVQALKNFSDRLDMAETTSFARSIIQAEQLGMSLARILKVQAQDSRQKRQMWAEEKAMKAPIKMLFPTVIFIFPAMFIVILGPAMLKLMQLFKGFGG